MRNERPRWNWLEQLIEPIPVNYFLASYFSSLVIFSIYYLFSWRVILFQWHIYHALQSLGQSILVGYLMAGLIYLSARTREVFGHIDIIYDNRSMDFSAKIEKRVTGAKGHHLILLLSVIAPFVILSWGQLPYYQWEPSNWALGLDIFGYSLSFLILALLTELIWLMANIVWSVNELGCASNQLSSNCDVFSLDMKLNPIKNFFLIFISYYFIAIALIIGDYTSPTGEISYEPIYFAVLLAVGVALFIAGLEAVQRIISCRVEKELEILNFRREEQYQLLIGITSGNDSLGKTAEIDYISNLLNIIQKERESLLQINRRAYDITSMSLFISSFLIPLLTLLEKLGILKV
ncbi:MAG: hypothetical protein A4E45_01625 [Methanosaeta sp. PtaB.Bin039]|nr:MAG: hypothetical protein A4E45_01625 [Methanosaeta sp. PtaB.Bin039]